MSDGVVGLVDEVETFHEIGGEALPGVHEVFGLLHALLGVHVPKITLQLLEGFLIEQLYEL